MQQQAGASDRMGQQQVQVAGLLVGGDHAGAGGRAVEGGQQRDEQPEHRALEVAAAEVGSSKPNPLMASGTSPAASVLTCG
ncbi:hypothetical protein ACFQY7_07735 [Actinomadura luteofluorescens]|uniref:hypothetical protein n=1 Tax=Actinomadura luteofluorescens TaxID=46163 RepID=UPI003625E3E8